MAPITPFMRALNRLVVGRIIIEPCVWGTGGEGTSRSKESEEEVDEGDERIAD